VTDLPPEKSPQELWAQAKREGWIETVVRTNYGVYRPDGLERKLIDALINNRPKRRQRAASKLWKLLDDIVFQHAEAVSKAAYEDNPFTVRATDSNGDVEYIPSPKPIQ
jgi:hypothetical protein